MIYVNFSDIRDPLKQNLALQFCRNYKDISIFAEAHINFDQIHHIRNNWLGPIFSSSEDSHTKGLLVLLHLDLAGVTDIDTDPKRRFLTFKFTPSNNRVLFIYVPLGHSTREQLAMGCFSEELQNYSENKTRLNLC